MNTSPNKLSPGDVRRIDPDNQTANDATSPTGGISAYNAPVSPGGDLGFGSGAIPQAILPECVRSLCDGVLYDIATGKPADIQPGRGEK